MRMEERDVSSRRLLALFAGLSVRCCCRDCAPSAERTRSRDACFCHLSSSLSLLSLFSLSLSLSLSHTHTHTPHSDASHHTTAQGRSARRAMASANTCRCICSIILLKKATNFVCFLYLKKNRRGRHAATSIFLPENQHRALAGHAALTAVAFERRCVSAWARAPADTSGKLCLPGGPRRWWWW